MSESITLATPRNFPDPVSPPLTRLGPPSPIPILRATYTRFNGPECHHLGVQRPDSPSIHLLYVDTFDTLPSCLPLDNQLPIYPIYFYRISLSCTLVPSCLCPDKESELTTAATRIRADMPRYLDIMQLAPITLDAFSNTTIQCHSGESQPC